MEETTPDAFPTQTHRRYTRGRTWLLWQWSPTLGGVAWWGRPDIDDVRRHVTAMQFRERGEHPMDGLVDASRVQAVEVNGFAELLKGLTGQLPLWNRRVGKLVVLMPDGWVGALVSGLWHVLAPSFSWQACNSMEAALRILPADALDATLEVARLVTLSSDEQPLLRQLQTWLGSGPRHADIHEAALELGTSRRTLQRALAQAQTTFRQQLILAQRSTVERLLVETDDKIDAVAVTAGFRSLQHMSTQFKRWTGMSPSEYRSRARGQP